VIYYYYIVRTQKLRNMKTEKPPHTKSPSPEWRPSGGLRGTLPGPGDGLLSVITQNICISDFQGAKEVKELNEKGITAIFCLNSNISASQEELKGAGAAVETVVHKPLRDGAHFYEDLKEAVGILSELCSNHSHVLVHCYVGQSRSPAVVAAYLGQKEGITADKAFDLISSKRQIYLTRSMMTDIARCIHELSPLPPE